MNTELMFSSKTDLWATPNDFFDKLNKEFDFKLDPCCNEENQKCNCGWWESDNGLIKEWAWAERIYMNPPYGKEIGKWVKKAYEESLRGCIVVCLLPSRTDTKWFHDYCLKGEIRYIKGRLKFGDSKNSAPFPSMLVIFGGGKQ